MLSNADTLIADAIKDRVRGMSDREFMAFIAGVRAAKTAAVFSSGLFLSDACSSIDEFEIEASKFRRSPHDKEMT